MNRATKIAACALVLLCMSFALGDAQPTSVESLDRTFAHDARYTRAPEKLTPKPLVRSEHLWKWQGLTIAPDPKWQITWMSVRGERTGTGFKADGRDWSIQFTRESFESIYIHGVHRALFRARFPDIDSFKKVAPTELAIVDKAVEVTRATLAAADPDTLATLAPLLVGVKLFTSPIGDYRYEGKGIVAHVGIRDDKERQVASAWVFDQKGRYQGYLVIVRWFSDKPNETFAQHINVLLSRMSFEAEEAVDEVKK